MRWRPGNAQTSDRATRWPGERQATTCRFSGNLRGGRVATLPPSGQLEMVRSPVKIGPVPPSRDAINEQDRAVRCWLRSVACHTPTSCHQSRGASRYSGRGSRLPRRSPMGSPRLSALPAPEGLDAPGPGRHLGCFRAWHGQNSRTANSHNSPPGLDRCASPPEVRHSMRDAHADSPPAGPRDWAPSRLTLVRRFPRTRRQVRAKRHGCRQSREPPARTWPDDRSHHQRARP